MLNSVLNVKAVVATFNQEKALVGAFSVITNLFEALVDIASVLVNKYQVLLATARLPRLS